MQAGRYAAPISSMQDCLVSNYGSSLSRGGLLEPGKEAIQELLQLHGSKFLSRGMKLVRMEVDGRLAGVKTVVRR
jgi:hypothetical protein